MPLQPMTPMLMVSLGTARAARASPKPRVASAEFFKNLRRPVKTPPRSLIAEQSLPEPTLPCMIGWMKHWMLISAGLRRKPVRTFLTGFAITVAFLLFGVMHGVLAGFDDALDTLSQTRLRVMNRANMLSPLPIAHGSRIEIVEGVRDMSHITIFGGYYQDLSQSFNIAAVEMDSFIRVVEEFTVPDDQQANLLRSRTGALVGNKLAERFGWQIGDQIPVVSFFYADESGSSTWTVEILAIAEPRDEDSELLVNEMYFHYDYLDEARATDRGTVHQFMVTVDDRSLLDSVAEEIDALFANSSNETTTLDDKQYVRSQLAQIGDLQLFVNSILSAVLFTLLFLTGTTMMQSMRERIPELGVLKSMGYTDASVFRMILVESLVLCAVAAGIGLGVAAWVFPSVFGAFGIAAPALPASVYGIGFGIAGALSVGVAIWPAWRARTLPIAQAVSGR